MCISAEAPAACHRALKFQVQSPSCESSKFEVPPREQAAVVRGAGAGHAGRGSGMHKSLIASCLSRAPCLAQRSCCVRLSGPGSCRRFLRACPRRSVVTWFRARGVCWDVRAV